MGTIGESLILDILAQGFKGKISRKPRGLGSKAVGYFEVKWFVDEAVFLQLISRVKVSLPLLEIIDTQKPNFHS